MSKLEDKACRRARGIFVRAFGERGAGLFTASSTGAMMQTITAAFARRMGRERAECVGFHLGDWAKDAAIVLALHLFPEKFGREEIRAVTDNVAAHLPYHCAALGTLFGYEDLARSGIREGKKAERPRSGSRQRRVRAVVSKRKFVARRA